MDLKDFIENGLGTLQYGYFAAKSVPKWTLRDNTDWAGWETLMHSVERLKGGDFEALDDAWDVYLRTPDPLVQDACQILFGNAGTFSLYQKMRAELERSREEDPPLHYLGKSIDFCNAFTRWGRLDVVPVLLDTYLSLILKGIRHDIGIIPVLIDEFFTDETEDTLISHGTTEDMIDEYFTLVLDAYEEKCRELGSSRTLVCLGEPFSIQRVAERMRFQQKGMYNTGLARLRNIFEATTGIDCSAIFMGPQGYDPLAAAAIAEDFLESEEAGKYEPGVRYFFGHRIPD